MAAWTQGGWACPSDDSQGLAAAPPLPVASPHLLPPWVPPEALRLRPQGQVRPQCQNPQRPGRVVLYVLRVQRAGVDLPCPPPALESLFDGCTSANQNQNQCLIESLCGGCTSANQNQNHQPHLKPRQKPRRLCAGVYCPAVCQGGRPGSSRCKCRQCQPWDEAPPEAAGLAPNPQEANPREADHHRRRRRRPLLLSRPRSRPAAAGQRLPRRRGPKAAARRPRQGARAGLPP